MPPIFSAAVRRATASVGRATISGARQRQATTATAARRHLSGGRSGGGSSDDDFFRGIGLAAIMTMPVVVSCMIWMVGREVREGPGTVWPGYAYVEFPRERSRRAKHKKRPTRDTHCRGCFSDAIAITS